MNQSDSKDMDALGQLLRTAGAPKEPDEVQTARVRASVQAHWQNRVAQQQRRTRLRYGLGGLSAVAAVAAVYFLAVVTPWQAPVVVPAEGGAMVTRLEGKVFLQLGTTPTSHVLSVGDEIPPGATIVSGAGERLAAKLSNGMSLRLDQASRLVYQDPRNLKLEQGAVYFSSATGGTTTGESITVHTSLGDVRDIGTQFEVRLDGEGLSVRVREGEIELSHGSGKAFANARTELRLGASGVVKRIMNLDAHDASWDWVSGIAPIPTFEGKNLGFFIDWYARERGFDMVFEDTAVAANHRLTEINGDFAGFSPDTLLEVVLPACGLEHERQGGKILIKEASGAHL
ncbi:FecR family protein [Acanthopleuribacter pedis]|uniref:FecR domain-containing protein n=1 Tax=Acanthopleuribacter pedis TaxID=442870 RepID=A0A8J7QC62_9BACT|nr:FecR family protein [Acanthopleuribacter pedis]MBO1321034.1 FecR domain-containing protein [Acanthopleuribacter pedis]